jgi:hypothetical protein
MLAISCRGDSKSPSDRPVAETTLTVRVPFSSSGSVEVVDLEDNSRWTAALGDHGEAELKLFAADGNFGVAVSDVTMLELATDGLIAAGEMQWRVPALNVQKLEHRDVVVSPWKHIAWAGAGEDPGSYQKWKKLGDLMLTCGKAELAGVFDTMPLVPEKDGDVEALTPSAWARLLWGGWSELAVWLSLEASVPAGTRIHTMSLTEDVALDASGDGSIDSLHNGVPVELVDGYVLPSDIMRQPLGQSIRRYADRNDLGIDSEAILDLLGCLSSAIQDRWSTYGGTFDIEGPTLLSEVPVDGAVIHGQQDYRCKAADALSEIFSINAVARREGETLDTLLTQVDRALDGRTGTFKAVIDTPASEDGQVSIVCSAMDRWGNGSEVTTSVTTHNTAGTVSVAEPSADSRISGDAVLVRCACQDEYLEDCYLSHPTVEDGIATDIGDDEYLLDTTGLPDGLYAIECSNKSVGIEPVSNSIQVEVDNSDPGSLNLCAFADTALAEAKLEPCWLQPDASCEPMVMEHELHTDSAGCATVPLPDDRSGQLHVRTHGGWYWSAVHRDDHDEPVRIYAPSEHGVTATFSYVPSRPATVLDGRRASYATTWADAWAFVRLDSYTTPEQMVDVIEDAYSRFGVHFGRDLHASGIDIRATTPRDLIGKTPHSSATSEPSTRLGAVQAAIAQCTAAWSTANGSAPDALPSLTFAGEMVPHDAGNLYYDGLDAHGVRLNVMGHDVDHNTLRYTLVTCGAFWLDSTANRTTLRAQNLSQPDGFFQVVSSNQDRQLFGPLARDFLVFDRTDPDVTAILVDQDLAPLPLDPVPVDRAVILQVVASDNGGFAGADGIIRPVVSIEPGPVAAIGPGVLHGVSYTTLGVNYTIALHSLAEGEQTLRVSQADALSNVADAKPILFLVDRKAPTVTPTIPDYTKSPAFEVAWSADEPLSEVTVYGGARVLATVTGDATSTEVDVATCNVSHNITLVVKDQAKNPATMAEPHVVLCDDRPPEFLNTNVPTHTNSTQIPVSWSNTEHMRSIAVLINGNVAKTLDGTTTSTTLSLPDCDATYEIGLHGVDLAGNDGQGPVHTVTCETTKPIFSKFSVPADTQLTSVLATWEVSEPLRQLEVLVDGSVTDTITDGRTRHQVLLPACNEDYTIQLRATDLAGNSGQSDVRQLTCDDRQPTIVAHSVPALITGTEDLAEMLVSWSVDEPIQWLAISVGDIERLISLNSSIDHASVSLPRCNARFAVTMRVYDFAGNGSDPVGPDVVACDMYEPYVALMVSKHAQENAMNMVCDVDSCNIVVDGDDTPESIDLSQPGPHDVYHYKSRYHAGHNALPFIKFQASDLGDVKTDDDTIVVEYFYQGSDGDAFAEWRHLARVPDTSNTYRLELSPDSLLPSIYDTDAEQVHTVTLRSRDAAGRYSEEIRVDFRLHYLFPPLVLSDAQLSGSITRLSLEDGNIHEFFWAGESAEVVTMQVYWPWGNNNSPTHNAILDLGSAVMSTRISHLSQAKHLTSDYRWQWGIAGWSCGDSGHNFGTLECNQGLAMEEEIPLEGPATHHAMIYTVEGATHRGGNRYEIEPNRAYTIRISARDPHVNVDGERFAWRRQDGQYEYARVGGEEYDRRRFMYNSDLQRSLWALHLRSFAMQTYVSELILDVAPISVQANVGGQASGVVSAIGHEAAMESWKHRSSIH